MILPALRLLLVNRLQKATQVNYSFPQKSVSNHTKRGSSCQEVEISSLQIPLSKIKNIAGIHYTSAIALKLSATLDIPASKIAQDIQASLTTTIENCNHSVSCLPLERIWENFLIHVSPSGWISFQLHPVGLAEWLELLMTQPLNCNSTSKIDSQLESELSELDVENDNQNLSNFTNVFLSQYIYARCCALLRLAKRDVEAQLNVPLVNAFTKNQSTSCSNPLPWLTPDRSLRLTHPAECQLIDQLVVTLDALGDWKLGNLTPLQLRQTHTLLSQRFQRFDAACRIWGEVKATHVELAQVRLGLVMATQKVLRLLLEDVLGVVAPAEL